MVKTNMNELSEVPPPRSHQIVQKVKNHNRLLKIEQIIRNVTGYPNDNPGVRTVALDKLRSERRSEERDKRRRTDKKYDIFNGNAFEEDLELLLLKTLDSDQKFSSDNHDASHVHLVMLDMRMLNYFNSLPSEYAAGDEYKRFVSDTISGKTKEMKGWKKIENFSFASYLTGGDEFKVLVKGERGIVEKFTREIAESVAQYRHPEDKLMVSGVDISIESVDHIVSDIQNNTEGAWIRELPIDHKRVLVGKLLSAYSERSVTVLKFLSRIEFLFSIYTNSPDIFDSAYAFATKGGIQITKDELVTLFNESNREKATRAYVRDVFAKKDEFGLMRNQGDPFQKYKFQTLSRLSAQLLHD